VIITMSSCGAEGCPAAGFGFAARFGAAAFGVDERFVVLVARRAAFVGDADVVNGADVDLRRVDFFVSGIYDFKTSVNKTLSLSR
jgi:hypothetical protein